MHIWDTNIDQKLKKLPICIIVALLILWAAPSVFAALPSQLPNRFDKISSPGVSDTALHSIGFDMTNLTVPIGSVSIEFCSNSPLLEDPCTAPSGFDASTATLNSQQGETGFSIGPGSTGNKIILTRPAALPIGTSALYVFGNIKNPNSEGSYYGRLQTFTSTDASGLPVQYGGIVFSIQSPLSVTTEVPPYLTFCVGVTIVLGDCSSINSYFIDEGELSTQNVRAATSELMIATNAASGYAISLSGSTLTSGSHTIPPILAASGSTAGTSQFGLNLRSNTNPSIGNEPAGYPGGTPAGGYATPNKFQFQNGDTLATSTSTSDYEKFTVSYITNISSAQAAGIYTTTLTYIALANF